MDEFANFTDTVNTIANGIQNIAGMVYNDRINQQTIESNEAMQQRGIDANYELQSRQFKYQSELNKQAFDFQNSLNQKQYDVWRRMKGENAVLDRQSLSAAGLNANALGGSYSGNVAMPNAGVGASGSAAGGSAPGGSVTGLKGAADIGAFVSGLAQSKLASEQANLVQAQTKNVEQQTTNLQTQNQGQQLSNDYQVLVNGRYNEIMDQTLENMQTSAEVNRSLDAKQKKELDVMQSNMDYLKKQCDMIDSDMSVNEERKSLMKAQKAESFARARLSNEEANRIVKLIDEEYENLKRENKLLGLNGVVAKNNIAQSYWAAAYQKSQVDNYTWSMINQSMSSAGALAGGLSGFVPKVSFVRGTSHSTVNTTSHSTSNNTNTNYNHNYRHFDYE